MRNLTIDGKVLVFKSLAISKIVHLSLIATTAHPVIIQLKLYKNLYETEKILK